MGPLSLIAGQSDFQVSLRFDITWLFGQRLQRDPEEMKSCRIGGICPSVRLSIHPSPPEAPQRLAQASQGRAQASQSRSSQLIFISPSLSDIT